MPIAFEPAVQRPLPDLAAAFNDAFRGYVGGEITFDTLSFGHFLHRQGVDLAASIVASEGGGPITALALMGRRGWTSRLAAMGVTTSAQERGVGKALVARLVHEARQRGDRCVELEVIRSNPRGVRLYQGAGFTPVQALLGFDLPPLDVQASGSGVALAPGPAPAVAAHDPDLEQVDPHAVTLAVARFADDDTPRQASATLLSTFGPPVRGFRLGPAWAMVTPPRGGKAALLALVVAADARGRGHGARLLAALRALESGAALSVPPVCPERHAPFFERAGAAVAALSQWQMRLDLGAARSA